MVRHECRAPRSLSCPQRGFSGIYIQVKHEATRLIIASADFSHLLLSSTPIIQDQLIITY